MNTVVRTVPDKRVSAMNVAIADHHWFDPSRESFWFYSANTNQTWKLLLFAWISRNSKPILTELRLRQPLRAKTGGLIPIATIPQKLQNVNIKKGRSA